MIAIKCYRNGAVSVTIIRRRAITLMMRRVWRIIVIVEITCIRWMNRVIIIQAIRGGRRKVGFPLGARAPVNDFYWLVENYYYIGMGRFRDWVDRQIGRTKASPLWRLFLTGLRGQMDAKNPKPYNFYIKILSAGGSILIAYYFLLFRKVEMDIQGHNILVPDYVYRVREENYIYW